jgi:hypothetical protein
MNPFDCVCTYASVSHAYVRARLQGVNKVGEKERRRAAVLLKVWMWKGAAQRNGKGLDTVTDPSDRSCLTDCSPGQSPLVCVKVMGVCRDCCTVLGPLRLPTRSSSRTPGALPAPQRRSIGRLACRCVRGRTDRESRRGIARWRRRWRRWRRQTRRCLFGCLRCGIPRDREVFWPVQAHVNGSTASAEGAPGALAQQAVARRVRGAAKALAAPCAVAVALEARRSASGRRRRWRGWRCGGGGFVVGSRERHVDSDCDAHDLDGVLTCKPSTDAKHRSQAQMPSTEGKVVRREVVP